MPEKIVSARGCFLALSVALGTVFPFADPAAAGTETVLYSFKGGTDGSNPFGDLVIDKAGNLYGTTLLGGGTNMGCYENSCGTVFAVAPDGTETILHAFTGGSDGYRPEAGLAFDRSGNLYGTTFGGGSSDDGTVFKVAIGNAETVIYAFHGGADGVGPESNLAADKKGDLFGTTIGGGHRLGTVFKLKPNGKDQIVYAFEGGTDGVYPEGNLVRDASGNLYGTTEQGGEGANCVDGAATGCGIVFKISAGGTETVLHAFQGGSDGDTPIGGLVMDAAGNLYGTTQIGGSTSCVSPSGCGTVFRIAPDGTETILYRFVGGSDGLTPSAGLILDKAGNLYGTTFFGGGGSACNTGSGCGTVFKLAPNGTETVLYAFSGGADGSLPYSPVSKGPHGLLYGMTAYGGANGDGVVFSVKD